MRSLLIASAGVALLVSDAAGAQRVVAHGPGASFSAPGVAGQVPVAPRPPMAPRPPIAARPAMMPHQIAGRPAMSGQRWGNKIGGRWYAGVNAPGGLRGYRQPYRGWALPSYWISPSFLISDWSGYGLSRPPYGYSWSRYYDDAVLIDGRGSVYDSVGDVNWDGYDDRGYDAPVRDDRAYDDSVYGGPDDRGYAQRDYQRRDNGVGGAVTGAVVGGVAGNLIGGRGNRLGGTLVGAGVGAAAGYAIDKHEDDRRGPPPPPPREYRDGRGYAPGVSYAPPPPPPAPYYPPVRRGAPAGWVSPDGRTSVVTTNNGGYYGTGVTTVTVQTAPVVTTTTEVYEDTVTYSHPKKVYRSKHVWRARPRCGCR
jgi:Ni/Co efflux regulator RcnB